MGAFASGLAPSFSWLVAARIFIGFCSGTMSTANAYIADISSPKERAGPDPNPTLALALTLDPRPSLQPQPHPRSCLTPKFKGE